MPQIPLRDEATELLNRRVQIRIAVADNNCFVPRGSFKVGGASSDLDARHNVSIQINSPSFSWDN